MFLSIATLKRLKLNCILAQNKKHNYKLLNDIKYFNLIFQITFYSYLNIYYRKNDFIVILLVN